MQAASEVEARQLRHHALLNDVVAHIARRHPLERWSVELRRVFLLALVEEGLAAPETWKVTALRRHLFGTTAPPPLERWDFDPRTATDDERAAAERLRADLPGHVKLRSALSLLEIAREPCGPSQKPG